MNCLTIEDFIIEKENKFMQAIKEAGADVDHKLLIWGGGEGARHIYRYLLKQKLEVAHIVVNRKYFTEGQTICDRKVEVLEDIRERQGGYTLIIGFRGYTEDMLQGVPFTRKRVLHYDIFCGLIEDGYISHIPYTWIKEQEPAILEFYNQLEDDKSREALSAYLNQKISGEYSYNKKVCVENQYFDESIVRLQEGEVFVDCGSYTGDTIANLLKNLRSQGISGYKAIYCFEPDAHNYEELLCNTEGLAHCNRIQAGTWNGEDQLYFSSGIADSSYLSEEGDTIIKVVSIDATVADNIVTMIKMDVEGSELESLQGAKNTIMRDKPRLAICIYHKKEDLIDIPKYIHELVPEYKFYVRNYDLSAIETVLYAMI